MTQKKYPITLIATLGSSPSILTETIWCINKEGWGKIETIEIITTNHGRKKIEDWLEKDKPDILNGFEQVCDRTGIEITTEELKKHIHVPSSNGTAIEDIRTADQDQEIGELIKQIVQKHSQKDAAIIASLAGGRKTMGARMSLAMELFGRPGDQLVHVLVNSPFDSIDDFYFPEQKQQEIEYQVDSDNTELVFAKDAKVELVKIPFLTLGTYIAQRYNTYQPLKELIDEVLRIEIHNQRKDIHYFKINVRDRKITINKKTHEFELPAWEFTLLYFFARVNIEFNKVHTISFKEICENNWLGTLHQIWLAVNDGHYEEDALAIILDDIDNTSTKNIDYYKRVWKGEGDDEDKSEKFRFPFSTYRTRLKKKVNEELENTELDINFGHFFYFASGYDGENTLDISPTIIDIVDEYEKLSHIKL